MLGGLMIFLISMIGYFMTQSSLFSSFFNSQELIKEAEQTKDASNILQTPLNTTPKVQAARDDSIIPITHAPSIFYYFPPDPGLPELAKAPRLPISCIRSSKQCICYDQYNQRIEDFPVKRCNDIVEGKNPIAFTLTYNNQKMLTQ